MPNETSEPLPPDHRPLNQTFKTVVVCTVLGQIMQLVSIIQGKWIFISIDNNGRRSAAIEAGLLSYCINMDKALAALTTHKCKTLTSSTWAFEGSDSAGYIVASFICFSLSEIAALVGIGFLVKCALKRGLEHFWAALSYLSATVYSCLAAAFLLTHLGPHLICLHLQQAQDPTVRYMWGMYLYGAGVAMQTLASFLLVSKPSMSMPMERDSRGASIYSFT